MINVTKTYLPPFEEYAAVLKRAWDKGWITNHGGLVQELETKLKDYLGVDHFLFCSNGTIVLQMALKALSITKEVITTPFSYVATANAILWEGCTPVFVDIRPDTYCIDESKIEAAITENTQAILATHVYGYPCEVDKIEKIAAKYKLKIIYDAAHAFGCTYKGKSLLSFGDISTCSFHATKIFHTVEGGGLICRDEAVCKQLMLYRSFGHIGDDYFSIGINAKNSELHAAMGLCILPRIGALIGRRKELYGLYNSLLNTKSCRCFMTDNFSWNFSYYPFMFETEQQLINVMEALQRENIFTRRYFYPSINELPYMPVHSCGISESVSRRVLALPVFYELTDAEVAHIATVVNANL